MNKNNDLETPNNQPKEAAEEIARNAADAAKKAAKRASDTANNVTAMVEDAAGDVHNATKKAGICVSDKAKEIYHTAAVKSEETLTTSKEYVRKNPVPVVLGAVAFGAALGCMVMMARRKPTFGQRYEDEPLVAVRDAIFGALAPVTHRVHQGYDSARDGAEKAMDRVHRFGKGHSCNSISDQIGRIGNNLKFW